MSKPKILVYGSGSGSGAEKLVESSRPGGVLDADIVGFVCNRKSAGIHERAQRLGIPMIYHPTSRWDSGLYQQVAKESGADFFAFSGWLLPAYGLDPQTAFNSQTVFNIHPGDLPEYGGVGMYGHHVHEKVIHDYKEGKITRSALCMHFVTPVYDQGPVFCRRYVDIIDGDNAVTLGARVNIGEHRWQARITSMVVHREIYWDGINHRTLHVPPGYSIDADA
ncbi:MAG: formyltransferase family protein [bacterium]